MNQAAGFQSHIPQISGKTVRRQRLFRQLDAGLKTRLILVSAPAGYGKTVLVADWLRSNALSEGWASQLTDYDFS